MSDQTTNEIVANLNLQAEFTLLQVQIDEIGRAHV